MVHLAIVTFEKEEARKVAVDHSSPSRRPKTVRKVNKGGA